MSINDDGEQKSLVTVTSQKAQGAVYAVVVRDNHNGLASSYVSGITYSCNSTAGDCSLECECPGSCTHLALVRWLVSLCLTFTVQRVGDSVCVNKVCHLT